MLQDINDSTPSSNDKITKIYSQDLKEPIKMQRCKSGRPQEPSFDYYNNIGGK